MPLALTEAFMHFSMSHYMLDVLHWLPLNQRISYPIITLVWRSLLAFVPDYLRELCCTTFSAPGRRPLRSTEQGLLIVHIAQEVSKQNSIFSVVRPSLWNRHLLVGLLGLFSGSTLKLCCILHVHVLH